MRRARARWSMVVGCMLVLSRSGMESGCRICAQDIKC